MKRTSTPIVTRNGSAINYTAYDIPDVEEVGRELSRVADACEAAGDVSYVTIDNISRSRGGDGPRVWRLQAIVTAEAAARLAPVHACDPETGVSCTPAVDAGPREQESDEEERTRWA